MSILTDINNLILENATNVSYKNNIITLKVETGDPDEIVKTLNNQNIRNDSGYLEISLSGLLPDTDVYYNEDEFIRNCKEVDCDSLPKSIAILYYKKRTLLFYKKGNSVHTNYFISNQISYNKFIELLKSKVFADSFDTISNQLLLYSLEKGVFKIELPILAPKLDDSKDFKDLVNLFSLKFNSPDFILHFKNQLYNLPILAETERLQYIITVLSELIQSAEIEYQLFSKKFSFKKLKTELRQEKESYFKSLADVLSKMTSQIISVPISISAAILASYKSEGWLQFLILVVYLGYTYFVLKIHGIYLADVNDLESSLEKDFQMISHESGLNQEEINQEKSIIQNKIVKIKSLISLFKFCFIIIAIVLCGYIIWTFFTEGMNIKSISQSITVLITIKIIPFFHDLF